MAAVLEQRHVGDPRDLNQPLGQEGSAKLQSLLSTGVLDEHRSKAILAAAQIPVVQERIVVSADEAAAVAAGFGFPVVMKGLVPGTVHKTEHGLVRLGIGSAAEAARQFQSLSEAMSGAGSVLVQRQLKAELELIVGLIRDPQFGPSVMLGLGGVMAEVFHDSVFAVAPLSHAEALRMIARLGAQQLLDGFRGAPAVDRDALAQILVHIGNLGCACPSLREIDINPLLVSSGAPTAVDATVIVD